MKYFSSGFPKVFTSVFGGEISCRGVHGKRAAQVGRLLSKGNLYIDENGCKVWGLEMSSSEKLIIPHMVYSKHPEKETTRCCC